MIPKVEIRGPDGTLYMTRWVLFKGFWFRIYLHHLHRSDFDRHLHDHPWPFVSFLLKGRYTEVTETVYSKSLPVVTLRENRETLRWINYRPDPTVPHRLELDNPVWSLVFVGRQVRPWGFHMDDGRWVHHEDYLDELYGKGNWAKTADVLDA